MFVVNEFTLTVNVRSVQSADDLKGQHPASWVWVLQVLMGVFLLPQLSIFLLPRQSLPQLSSFLLPRQRLPQLSIFCLPRQSLPQLSIFRAFPFVIRHQSLPQLNLFLLRRQSLPQPCTFLQLRYLGRPLVRIFPFPRVSGDGPLSHQKCPRHDDCPVEPLLCVSLFGQ